MHEPAEQVGETHRYTCPKQCIPAESTGCIVCVKTFGLVNFSLKDDSHDDSVDGDCLAEDDAE
jgi:hypothetical protein